MKESPADWRHTGVSFIGLKRTNRIVFLLLALVGVLLVRGLSWGKGSSDDAPVHHLVVLHTNDTHGHPLKFYLYPAPDVGGLPARATLIKGIKKENENVLLLDAGDLNTGRAESNLFRAKPDIIGYNYIGYDAMALGNHEFDHPLDVLRMQMAWAKFPFLSANIRVPGGKYLARPYIIKAFKGFKVAVLGLTTTETRGIANPQNIDGLIFLDEVETARNLVPELRRQADLVIALVHLGIYPSWNRGSKRLANEVEGIDLIVDGHTHTRLDAPIVVKHKASGRRTLIVQAWKWGLLMGRVDLWFQDSKIRDYRFRAIPVNLKTVHKRAHGRRAYRFVGSEVKEDRRLLAMLKPYADEVKARLSEVIGYAERPFLYRYARRKETPLGDLVADSMLWFTRRLGVDFAIQNGGGIRDNLEPGPITMRDIYDILPFENTVVVLSLTGKDIEAVFDRIGAVTRGRGAFPQVSEGLRFTINQQKKRCENILIHGRPVDPARVYRVATNSYLANGGDGYFVFRDAEEKYDTSMLQRDVLIRYIRSLGGRIRPKNRRRIHIIERAQPLSALDPPAQSDPSQPIAVFPATPVSNSAACLP